jgi:hypothetical protein
MGKLIELRRNSHDETQMLLPWYATGALDPEDRRQVDAHLATCATCREDLAFEKRLKTALNEIPTATDDQWDKMITQRSGQVADRRRWWQQPVRLAWFAGAQAAVVLLCVGLVASQRIVPPVPEYRVLGDAPATVPANILVMFAPGTPVSTVRTVMRATRTRLVKGPTAAGAYMLAVTPGARGAALSTLQARREVILAEPIDAPAR